MKLDYALIVANLRDACDDLDRGYLFGEADMRHWLRTAATLTRINIARTKNLTPGATLAAAGLAVAA